MKIHSLKMDNFGPFHGTHDLQLGVDDSRPIVLIYGENMRGKTSLLNAIRWCLYGKVFDRRGRLVPSYRLINYDALAEQDFHMRVILEYEHDGHNYELERHIQAQHLPKKDTELSETVWLKRDRHILDSGMIPDVIGDTLHPDIARFFLFDGEMLAHFEVLLADKGTEAGLVKKSIEQILGLPALKSMQEDLEELRREAERRQLEAVKNAKKGEELVADAQQVSNELDAVENDLKDLRRQLEDVETEEDEYRRKLDAVADVHADVAQLQQLEQAIQEQEKSRKLLVEESQGIVAQSWWMPAASAAGQMLARVTQRIEQETLGAARSETLRREMADLEEALDDRKCPTCKQGISAESREAIGARLESLRVLMADATGDQTALSEAVSTAGRVRPFASPEPLARLEEKEVQIRRLLLDIHKKRRQISEIRERLRNHDTRDIRATEERLERCIIQIEQIKKDIEEKEKSQASLDAALSRLNAEIRRLPTADPRTAIETLVYGALEKVFEGAIERFRDALRHDVEEVATDIFRSLTTEQEYARLAINDQYGLTIVDSGGRAITERSAGAEQVVALSLVGALNRCASREGPVVMDTPFGRLDKSHRKNIIEFVPSMSTQVVLLVQSGEFDRATDQLHLQGRVSRTYEILRDGSPTRSRFATVT